MKTRNEIYQGEGAQLLRFITTYHSLQYEQVLRLFSKNRESIKSLITSLVKQKRIIYDKENGLLFDSQESANNPDYGMIASFWVLLDFKTAIVYHTDGEFPVKLNFFSKDEWYEVLYVPQEQEYLINHVMESQTKSDAKRLVVFVIAVHIMLAILSEPYAQPHCACSVALPSRAWLLPHGKGYICPASSSHKRYHLCKWR